MDNCLSIQKEVQNIATKLQIKNNLLPVYDNPGCDDGDSVYIKKNKYFYTQWERGKLLSSFSTSSPRDIIFKIIFNLTREKATYEAFKK